MPAFGPISRDRFIHALRQLGFSGPYAGGSHSIMRRGSHNGPIPNPHEEGIGVALLRRILRIAGVSRDAWEAL
jgi:predicted RNA binding protein YcfA (HicA-like mRNA interferase family)